MEKTNGAKLSRLLIDGGTAALRGVFDSYYPPANLAAKLQERYSNYLLLLRIRSLNKRQWEKLFPPDGSAPDSKTFDITLLFILLTNICGLSPPPSGWHSKPSESDTSFEANLVRIKFYRNVLYGHASTTGVDTPTFFALWREISTVLVALGLDQAEIDRLEAEHFGEEDYLHVILEWVKSEEDVKSEIKEFRATVSVLSEKVQTHTGSITEVKEAVADTHHTLQGTLERVEQKCDYVIREILTHNERCGLRNKG